MKITDDERRAYGKSVAGILCDVVLLFCYLLAVPKTPTEDIVVNKNEGKLEQAIREKIRKDSDTSVPEKYTDQFQADGEK